MDTRAVFSKVNSGLTLSILLSSIITLYASYSGKVCFESTEDSKKLIEDNGRLYYSVIISIIIFLIIFVDNGLDIVSSIQKGNQSEILPLVVASLFSLFGIITSSVTLDCYNRDKSKGSRYTFVDYTFKLSLGVIAILVFLLRHVLSPFLFSLVSINSFVATYIALKCHKAPEYDKLKLSEKYLDYNLYFSGVVSILSVLMVIYKLNFE